MAKQEQFNMKMPEDLKQRLRAWADSQPLPLTTAAKLLISRALTLEEELAKIKK